MTYKIVIQLITKYPRNVNPSLINHVLCRVHDYFHVTYSTNKMCTVMDSFLKSVFIRAGKHTSVHDVHPHLLLSLFVLKLVKHNQTYYTESNTIEH